VDRDVGPGIRQRDGCRAADSGAGARHYRSLTGQVDFHYMESLSIVRSER
jgi:hypothetical protein